MQETTINDTCTVGHFDTEASQLQRIWVLSQEYENINLGPFPIVCGVNGVCLSVCLSV